MEYLVLGAFCISLLLCIIMNISILYALVFGLIIFLLYGRRKGFQWRDLAEMALNGIKTVGNILLILLLIGIMTALWRAAGTIPFIVCQASKLIRPSGFLLMTFLLNSGMSIMTGTSFGTAATMGVICASMGTAMNVSPLLTGGAILSGVYFGDRCSPVSTSALLVASITVTEIYDNIRNMLKSALVPFVLTCLLYVVLGLLLSAKGETIDMEGLFSRTFLLSWTTAIPALIILLLSVLHVNVKWSMGVSILAAAIICITVQRLSITEILRFSVLGYTPQDPAVALMMSGGGIISMLKVACIVCISSAYTDIFNKTELLDGARQAVSSVAAKTTTYAAMAITAAISGMIACNQTLTILLTNQLGKDLYTERETLALDLEDSAVVIAPLIPWSIAGAVPLAAVDAPHAAVVTAFYLLLLPIYRLLASTYRRTKQEQVNH